MLKLYCYTDETGQDTKGRFFLVSIVIAEKDNLEMIKQKITGIEAKTKGDKKWTKTNNREKKNFIEEIFKLNALKGHIFYCRYKNTFTYIPLTAFSIGKAIIQETKDYQEDYKANVIIDGLQKHDQEIVRRELKVLNIKYDKIKIGLDDEQEVLLRLADAMAGFIRDYFENRKYLKGLVSYDRFKRFFKEIQ